jgi:hypothetical protein
MKLQTGRSITVGKNKNIHTARIFINEIILNLHDDTDFPAGTPRVQWSDVINVNFLLAGKIPTRTFFW